MKIQRQCHALADALNDAVRKELRNRVELYCNSHEQTGRTVEPPDEEIQVDDHDNTILIGGTLSGDRTNVSKCIIGEGVDVVVGEGSVVVGCIFSRLALLSTTDEGVKELHVRHTIEIGKNCVLIGCLIRDDVVIGDNATMAASAASQVTLGKDARLFMSSVLARYGTIGERFTAVQTLFHTDKCEMGADAFMCSGKWGIISWENAYSALDGEMTDRCSTFTYDTLTGKTLRELFENGVKFYEDQTAKAAKYEETHDELDWECKYAHPPVYRRQYLALDKLTAPFELTDNIIEFVDESMTVEHCTFPPMVVLFRDYITDTRADQEVQNFDGHKFTFREAFSFNARIRIGNNLQVYATCPLCVTRIEQETWNSYREPETHPKGFGNFTWEKLGGHEYDLEIGDDCLITSSTDWVTMKPRYRYLRVGRLVMKDGVTLYLPGEDYGDASYSKSLQTVDVFGDRSRSQLLGVQTEYIFEEGSKIFPRGTVTCKQDSTPCHVWRLKVRKNDMAII